MAEKDIAEKKADKSEEKNTDVLKDKESTTSAQDPAKKNKSGEETLAKEAEDVVEDLGEQPDESSVDISDSEESSSSDEKNSDEEGSDEEGSDEETSDDKKKKFKGLKKKPKKDKKDEKIEELNDRLMRNLAEFENFRNRSEKEKSAMFDMGAKTVIEKMLPVVDNLERGFDGLSDEEKETPFVKGIEAVYKQVQTVFEELGVTVIEAVGQEFDPNLHNAVMHDEDDSDEANKVVEEFQKGYLYKDSVVRHSMVKVLN